MKIVMSMSRTTLFLWLSLVVAALSCIINLGCSYGEINGGMNCIKNERDALLKIKNALKDTSHRLASWSVDAAADCCNWYGVMCDYTTGHVLKLQLRSLSHLDEFSYRMETKKRSSFGGKISPSLLNLTHLRYLYLSNIVFEGIQIPKFLGSMESLRYLNLSNSGFGGHIPPQLGNLTNLLYLNLGTSYYGSSSISENVHWLSGLSSLQFLDLSGVNLNKSLNWMSVINTLPSLQELHLSNCRLPSPSLIRNLNLSSTLRVLDLSFNVFSPKSIFTWSSHLKHLKSLKLAHSYFPGSNIPPEFQNLSTSLRELDLSGSDINSSIPHWLYNFANLEFLNLAGIDFGGQISDTIQNMTSLVTLDMSNNYHLFGGIPASFRNLCNLRILSLASVNLSQNVTQFFENLLGCGSSGLESLDLENCKLFGNWVSKDLGQFKNLSFLDLSRNAISGPFPTSLFELKSLTSLDLSRNSISGSIPMSLGELKSLTSLVLPRNSLSGSIPMSLGELKSLRFLVLSNNKLTGDLPTDLGNLTKLEELNIEGNSISGAVPTSLGQLRTLKLIFFSSNKLNGTLPESFGRLSNLEWAVMNDNLMEGDVSEIHFANLSRLAHFYADGNKLNLKVGPNWIPPPPLEDLGLASWNVGSELPTWLPSLKNLVSLNLSNCGISTSSIPGWFWRWSSQLDTLILSHNNIQGVLPNGLTFPGLTDLSSNNFQGSLPHHDGTFLDELDLSNNSFSGSISNFLCRAIDSPTTFLNLENNILDGEIPDCWNRWKALGVLKLSDNKFNGSIPESIGSLRTLGFLHLHNNNLSGEVPLSLGDCTELVTLNIGGNNLEGNIPSWIGEKLLHLVILDFGRNSFSGKIPENICHLTSLHILHLSNNNLSGNIPSCVSNFSAMTNVKESTGFVLASRVSKSMTKLSDGIFTLPMTPQFFTDNMQIPLKGATHEYRSILGLVKSVDLSSNRLSGEIPEEITRLKGLQSVNLSHNSLSGRIPKNIGSTTSLESLDLRSNQLIGEIPQSISNLTFLGYLNLTNNKLSGRIPSGTQIQSLDSSCFIGNQLCGKPLTDNCSGDSTVSPPSSSEENGNKHDSQIEWLYYVTVALGFIVGFWGMVGPLLFNRNWRVTYFRFLQSVEDNIYIWWRFM